MTVYSISYDLRGSRDYDDLYDAIEDLGSTHHSLESTWLVDCDLGSAGDVKEKLEDHIDSDDGLLITKVESSGGGRWSYLRTEPGLSDWFDEHL